MKNKSTYHSKQERVTVWVFPIGHEAAPDNSQTYICTSYGYHLTSLCKISVRKLNQEQGIYIKSLLHLKEKHPYFPVKSKCSEWIVLDRCHFSLTRGL